MRLFKTLLLIVTGSAGFPAVALEPPAGLVHRVGDQSVVLHWDRSLDTNVASYRVYRAPSSEGPWARHSASLVTSAGFADLAVTNGVTYFYRVTSLTRNLEESGPSTNIAASPRPFASQDDFLDYVQQTGFDYFWYEANPANGMIKDRSTRESPASIAAVGFGLSAICIGVEKGWITREQGVERVWNTLRWFWEAPQGAAPSGTIGNRGWFYHFLDMNTGLRHMPFRSEVSTIDTALFLAGAIHCREFFDGTGERETGIRTLTDAIYARIDWPWMTVQTNILRMGWKPETGPLASTWIGYNEASILYIMGLGAPTNALPETAWASWTSGYDWSTNYGPGFILFPPLFGHQYSQCWLDLRHLADDYTRSKATTYFENSRRATLAQREYSIRRANIYRWYGSNVWGITASDVPGGYMARGAPPAENDDGTVTPTAPGGSIPFAPEYCIPALRTMYDKYRTNLWTSFGFRDAFHPGTNWWGPDVLGIDQGPIVIMIENHRSQSVWKYFMRNEAIRRGLQRAGFRQVSFVPPTPMLSPETGSFALAWAGAEGAAYRVEESPDLELWRYAPEGLVVAGGGPSALVWPEPVPAFSHRFYRVLEMGTAPP